MAEELQRRKLNWRDRAGLAVAALCSLSIAVGSLGGLISLLIGVSIWAPGSKPMPPVFLLLALLGLALWMGGNWGYAMLFGHGSYRRGVAVQRELDLAFKRNPLG